MGLSGRVPKKTGIYNIQRNIKIEDGLPFFALFSEELSKKKRNAKKRKYIKNKKGAVLGPEGHVPCIRTHVLFADPKKRLK